VELDLSRFTFHETDRLTSDLARLLRAQHAGGLACDSTNDPASCGTTAEFPGIILLYDDRPCAAIGYTREPRETFGICEPIVLQEATADAWRALAEPLIRAVKRLAISEGVRRLQALLPATADDSVFRELLTKHNFSCEIAIVQWDFSVTLGDRYPLPTQSEIQHYDFAASTTAAALEIELALAAVLESSEDLRSQPQPTAAELMMLWQRMQAQVFVYRMEEKIAGLIACMKQSMRSMAATDPADITSAETNICIEYIGVTPAFRRRQIASRLIHHIPALLTSVQDAHMPPDEDLETWRAAELRKRVLPQLTTVTAYSDAANTPANSLYRRCGFVQSGNRQLWCCDLAGESGP
jgi:ribosomal protein S18 acetylase RimI-like enzyme